MPKTISDHAKNVELWINWALCSSERIVECKPVLDVFSFHMLSWNGSYK